ncbi:MAG: peptidoglycan DD-metalloendopeptidase family protein [Candidatus Latescibacteria bacterium]|nr:peptidoglycan DD-metalloendopeptidase family protein [bacterium]MBD3423665.1 peptidoglycan DD-metalloendopeptidase family protein [Candidatus Latescibacterota bacterium]
MRFITAKKYFPLFFLCLVNSICGCTESPIYRGGRLPAPRERVKRVPDSEEKGLFSSPVYRLTRRRVSSWFGIRKRNNIKEFHKGIDIRARYGEAVLASASGEVEFTGRKSGFGRVIIISHGRGYHTVYAHLSAILCSEGGAVERGQRIGKAGRSGNATGVHLHFEIRKYSKALDPALFLDL